MRGFIFAGTSPAADYFCFVIVGGYSCSVGNVMFQNDVNRRGVGGIFLVTLSTICPWTPKKTHGKIKVSNL